MIECCGCGRGLGLMGKDLDEINAARQVHIFLHKVSWITWDAGWLCFDEFSSFSAIIPGLQESADPLPDSFAAHVGSSFSGTRVR